MAPEEDKAPATVASVEEIQQAWNDVTLRMSQLEVECTALQIENKGLRTMLERTIDYRQKSHSELILLLTGLVSKLPINDIGVVVSKLVEHNSQVGEMCAAMIKGKAEGAMPQPSILKAMEQSKRDLAGALKPLVEELQRLDSPFEADMLQSLVSDPKQFFSQSVVRANRCFVKGQLPRERVVRQFGEEGLVFFNDLTTDPKLNPRPKPDEIVMAFKPDFETLIQQDTTLAADKREQLGALFQKVQRSKAPTDNARAQKTAFQKLSFVLELTHYYANQSTEAPDVIFAQRLPALVEQLVITGPQDSLDEKAILQAESMLAHIVHPDHRLMVINNMGKGGGLARNLKFVMRLRIPKLAEHYELISEFVRQLIPSPPQKPPTAEYIAALLRLVPADMQGFVVRAIMSVQNIRRDEAEKLGRAVGKELGITGLEEQIRAAAAVPPETERQLAWDKIKELIVKRADPSAIAAAFRERLHAKYDADEIKQSWITLTEADTMSFIRTFCQLPYLSDGRTDSIAKPVMETYTSRLTHEKYLATYTKVANSLKNMFKANPHSPTLVNFIALVRWVDPEAANKLSADIGLPPM